MNLLQFDQFDFYIIHCKQSLERYNHLKNEFKKINIDIENNNKIYFCESTIPIEKGKYKKRGSYGTALGHIKAMRQSLENTNPYCFIVEDDVIFLDNFIHNINITLLNLYKNQEYYDILQFRRPKRFYKRAKYIIKDNYIMGNCRFVPTELFYLTKEIRQKIINNTDWFLDGSPVDVWYNSHLRCVKTIDNYTWQGSMPSLVRFNN